MTRAPAPGSSTTTFAWPAGRARAVAVTLALLAWGATSATSARAAGDEPSSSPSSPPPSASGGPVLDDAMRAEIDRLVNEKLEQRLQEQLDAKIDAAIEDRIAAKVDEKMDAKLDEKKSAGFFDGSNAPVAFSWKGDFFTKLMIRNNTSGGCVSYGNPAPEGDNFSGDNGICSELGLTLNGRVSDRVEVGARIQSRFGAQWAEWYENGDERDAPDGSGESLGQNHAAYLQLRGVYLRVAPPIPTVRFVHIGATDLGMYNAWTIGKARYTERDNGRGLFVDGTFGDVLSYNVGRIALPKLFAGPGYTTGISDPLIENPFWQRDAAWALKLDHDNDWFSAEQITSLILDEEADLDDPDAVGSTNAIDPRDGAVTTNARYTNVNATLDVRSDAIDWLGLRALLGYSYSKTNDALVFNSVTGAQGFTPVPMGEHQGYALVARADVLDPASIDLDVQAEYFNIGRDWTSVMGARREQDLLLTEGFVDGQVATLNVANEFQDFTEPFYEPIIGWHGATLLTTWSPGALELTGEGTFIEYNTDTGDQALDVDTVYPDFLYTDGMTDTELFNFANTNDRGRDPRSVYHRYQNRSTIIGALRGAYTFDVGKGLTLRARHKTIVDRDLRDPRPEVGDADNYLGLLFFNRIGVEMPLTDEFSAALGYQFDYWVEQHRSGDVVGGVANYPDYMTMRNKGYADLRYTFGGMNLWYHAEVLNKDMDVSDDRLDQRFLTIIRSLAMVSASF